MFQTLKLIPSHVLGLEGEMLGVMGFSLAAVLVLLVPFLDRKNPDGRQHPFITAAGILAVVYLIVFTIYGYLAA